MATSVEGSHFPAGTWEEWLLEWSPSCLQFFFFSCCSLLTLGQFPSLISPVLCSSFCAQLWCPFPVSPAAHVLKDFLPSAFAFSSLACLCQSPWALPSVLAFLSLFIGTNIRTNFPPLALALPCQLLFLLHGQGRLGNGQWAFLKFASGLGHGSHSF